MTLKFIIIFLAITAIFIPSTTPVSAHRPGEEPYFKINDKFTLLYPVLLIPSSNKFTLPQDIAPEMYKPNEEIEFEIIKERLPFTTNTLENSNFYWEFGDGETGSGILNTHTYEKEGSYILNVYIDYTKSNEKELLQSTMLYITKDPTQKLPVLRIKVNNSEFNKSKGNLKLDITKSNTFEAELLDPDNNENISNVKYLWDMSDGSTFEGKKINYVHKDNFLILNPLVRATTHDGFIYDAEVIIESTTPSRKKGLILPLIAINGTALILFAGFLLFTKLRNKT